MPRNMRILELTNFSKGICGVFARVKEESKRLSKNHEVMIFSSNFTKGSNEIAERNDEIYNVRIKRFPAKNLGGESFMFWDFEKDAIAFNPDVIICHSYRHPHTIKALKIKKKLNCKVFLVTHAPFDRERGFLQNFIVNLYDVIIGTRSLKKFDKVIAITKWEIPFLKSLKVNEEKIAYIPNGIPKEFFK